MILRHFRKYTPSLVQIFFAQEFSARNVLACVFAPGASNYSLYESVRFIRYLVPQASADDPDIAKSKLFIGGDLISKKEAQEVMKTLECPPY